MEGREWEVERGRMRNSGGGAGDRGSHHIKRLKPLVKMSFYI